MTIYKNNNIADNCHMNSIRISAVPFEAMQTKAASISTHSLRLSQTALLLTLLSLPNLCHSNNFSAKRLAQGFTSITQDFTASMSNPALLSQYHANDNAYFTLNLGIMVADKHEVIDTGERVADNLDSLADSINNSPSSVISPALGNIYSTDNLNQQVDVIIADLVAIDSKVVNKQNGLNFQAIIPNQYLSFGVFTNQYGRIGGAIDYQQSDEALLRAAIDSGSLALENLQSSATGIGYSIAEAGLMLGGNVLHHAKYDVSVGMKIKYQRIDLFYNTVNISDFDDDEFDLSNEENITDKSVTNADIGLYFNWGDKRQWAAAIVTNNIFSQEVQHSVQNLTFMLETSSTIGLSYQHEWVTLATEIDLTDREQFATLKASKYAGFGAEFHLYDYLQLRFGFRADVNDVDADIVTAGLGLTPWDTVAIDIGGFIGQDDVYGAAVQFGLKI